MLIQTIHQYNQQLATTHNSFLQVDLFNDTLCVTSTQSKTAQHLQLSITSEHKNITNKCNQQHSGEYIQEILDTLSIHYKNTQLRPSIVFGVKHDPFCPLTARLNHTLQIIEHLTTLNSPKLIIQTRSPFILLASPILKAISNRINVTMALEATTEDLHRYYKLERDPRPCERLEACASLTELGIKTNIQFSPISLNSLTKDLIKHRQHYCSTLNIIRLSRILSSEDLILLKNNTLNNPLLNEIAMDSDKAYKLIRNAVFGSKQNSEINTVAIESMRAAA